MPLKPLSVMEYVPEVMLRGTEVKDLCRLCLSELSEGCVEVCGTSAKACEIRHLYQTVMHKEIDLNDVMPKKVCSVCLSDLKTCSEVVERFKQADEYLQDIAQSPPFAEHDAMDLVKSVSNINPVVSIKRISCEKASSQVNKNASSHEPKQEIKTPELEDSTEEPFVSPSCLHSSKNKKLYRPKVTFKNETEIVQHISENIEIKVENQDTDDFKNYSSEMLSPSRHQQNRNKHCEVIVGPSETFLEPFNTEIKPQAPIYKCDVCSCDFKNPSALTAHSRIKHPFKKMRCPDPQCDFTTKFNTTAQLDEHYKEKHGLKCSMCDRICLTPSGLSRHMASEHTVGKSPRHLPAEIKAVKETQLIVQEPIRESQQSIESLESEAGRVCWICGAVLKNSTCLDRHIVTMHWEQKHVCVICDKTFPKELALKKHVRIHDPDYKVKRFFCQHCPKSYWNRYYLKEHLLAHAPLNHACESCGLRFIRKRNLLHHRARRNIMGFCPKSKKRQSECSLDMDKSNVTDSQSGSLCVSNVKEAYVKKFECDICKKMFIRKNNCDRHKRYHFCNGDPEIIKTLLNEPEIQECGICKRVLLSKLALQLHVSRHTNSTKPFQCEFCESTFAAADEYRAHELQHTGDMSYQCSQCEQVFSNKYLLEVHESEHSNDRPFKCPVCPMAFKMRKPLLRHTFSHKEEAKEMRPYQCTHCSKSYLTQQHLTKHLKYYNHGSVADWFLCSECGKEFKLFKSLKKHIQTKHGENETIMNKLQNKHQEYDTNLRFLHIVESEEVVE